MTMLAALANLYDRMADAGEAPPPGYSQEKISFEIVLDATGKVVRFADQRRPEGNKMLPKILAVPEPVKRTAGIAANLFWDKSAYVLGVTANEKATRTPEEHRAFRDLHLELLANSTDPGLSALYGFLEGWHPSDFTKLGYPVDALDQNIVFRLEGDKGGNGVPQYIHDRPAARDLVALRSGGGDLAHCLVTGKIAPATRLHPAIKGVSGAQSSGASLVSFNLDAFESYGKRQGLNAPVSEDAAFSYGAALNALLARDSHRNLRIGDTAVVFWAETPERGRAASLEEMMFQALTAEDEATATSKLRESLAAVAEGRARGDPNLDPDTRVYILGLAPNAARLALRFWYPGRFGDFARNVTRSWNDLAVAPPGWKGPPAIRSLLYETAVQGKAENIPPLLGGELMRAVLTGGRYPRTLLSSVIGRIRADGKINGRRVAICKAVINRNSGKEDISVSLDTENSDPAYRLGRLFAVLERTQSAALPGINATIKDRYFAAASATPLRVFPGLIKNNTHHLALLRKGEKGGLAHWLDRQMGEIWDGLPANLPRSLTLEDQGRFVAGYYHQRWNKTEKPEDIDTQIEGED